MKYLIAFLIGFILLMATLVHAEILYKDETGWYRKEYLINKRFDMCDCMNEGYKFFPNKREDQIEQLCKEAFIDYLMEKSKAINNIVTGYYYTCRPER